MPHDFNRPDEHEMNFHEEMEKAEARRLKLIDSIFYADFENKVLIGKGKAKDFKTNKP